jgi:hypothetical protein
MNRDRSWGMATQFFPQLEASRHSKTRVAQFGLRSVPSVSGSLPSAWIELKDRTTFAGLSWLGRMRRHIAACPRKLRELVTQPLQRVFQFDNAGQNGPRDSSVRCSHYRPPGRMQIDTQKFGLAGSHTSGETQSHGQQILPGQPDWSEQHAAIGCSLAQSELVPREIAIAMPTKKNSRHRLMPCLRRCESSKLRAIGRIGVFHSEFVPKPLGRDRSISPTETQRSHRTFRLKRQLRIDERNGSWTGGSSFALGATSAGF